MIAIFLTFFSNAVVSAEDTLVLLDFQVITDQGNIQQFDPSKLGQDEELLINYTFNVDTNFLEVEVEDDQEDIIKTLSSTSALDAKEGTFIWDGTGLDGRIVEPGDYTVRLNASIVGGSTIEEEVIIKVAYDIDIAPRIFGFAVFPDTFDPDTGALEVSFENRDEAELTLVILNSDNNVVENFDDYKNDDFDGEETHFVVWDGLIGAGSDAPSGVYKAKLVARSDYGVTVKEGSFNISNTGQTDSNLHINDIVIRPSTTFEPGIDDEIEIEFDVRKDLDELNVYARRGSEEYEIWQETDVSKSNNMTVYWDGTDDDDDFVDEGAWSIIFESEDNGVVLTTTKSISVSYDKPDIDDLELSKTKFDHELGEFTTLMVKVDKDSELLIEVMLDGQVDETLVEDYEISRNDWYGFEFDGGSYDYDDSLKLKVTAYNLYNDDVFSSDTISVDLFERSESDSKANISEDFIGPVIADDNASRSIFYYIDDDSERTTITIHRGKGGSGSLLATVIEDKEQDEGEYEIYWDGKRDNGGDLADGIYSYKIETRARNTDNETGTFIVGDVGEIDGTAAFGGDGNSDNNSDDDDDNSSGGVSDLCGGFRDVSIDHRHCDAIEWAESNGIVHGVGGREFFMPGSVISRVELLKVVLEAGNVGVLQSGSSDLGFTDVDVTEWYMPYIGTGKLLNIFEGDEGGRTARPGDPVNRVEALKMIFETLEVTEGLFLEQCFSSYADVPFNKWYSQYACGSYEYDLVDTGSINLLLPELPATRSEVVEMLYRMSEQGSFDNL